MKMRTRITIAFIILLSVTFVLLGMYGAREYRAVTAREAHDRLLKQELQKADAIADDTAAAAALKKLSPALPEIQLRIVQRQWRIALELLQYMQRARDNTELENETDAYSARLKTLLDEMIERCSSTLADAASLRPDIVWQLYNTAASAKVLSAFVMLETEQNVDKVQGVMRDALTDYKAAIEAVDKAGVPPSQKNIPRWNFEVLNGEENVKKFEVATTDTEKNEALKENLETVIPEIGGYGPGEPVETIIKK
jgi:isoleucyl-tRNA synthetase